MTDDHKNLAEATNTDFNTLSGLDFLRKLIANGDGSPMAQVMGITIRTVEEGRVTLSATPTTKLYNPMMRVHGGFAATVLDTVLGCSVMSKLAAGVGVGTIVLNVNYVRKIEAKTGEMIASGQVLHAGRSVMTAEAKLTDQSGRLFAHASGTFMVYPK
ncbi:MAG: PaaI family thioesterase [Alphaproteobacteria bacterium]|nr:PaaI family thioesterase [Alphaproteobacteria bacterium]